MPQFAGAEGLPDKEPPAQRGHMVRKCANPACKTLFRYYRGGRIMLLDLNSGHRSHPLRRRSGERERLEYFWLCEKCAPQMTLVVDADGTAIVQPSTRREVHGKNVHAV